MNFLCWERNSAYFMHVRMTKTIVLLCSTKKLLWLCFKQNNAEVNEKWCSRFHLVLKIYSEETTGVIRVIFMFFMRNIFLWREKIVSDLKNISISWVFHRRRNHNKYFCFVKMHWIFYSHPSIPTQDKFSAPQ